MNFLQDGLVDGRGLRVLPIVDDYTRECLAVELDTSLPGLRVVQVLDRVAEVRGVPEVILIDNGPEFTGQVLDAWAYQRGVGLHVIAPGKPVQHAVIESLHTKLRDECLHEHWFTTVFAARAIIEAWRQDDHEEGPTAPWATCRRSSMRRRGKAWPWWDFHNPWP